MIHIHIICDCIQEKLASTCNYIAYEVLITTAAMCSNNFRIENISKKLAVKDYENNIFKGI